MSGSSLMRKESLGKKRLNSDEQDKIINGNGSVSRTNLNS